MKYKVIVDIKSVEINVDANQVLIVTGENISSIHTNTNINTRNSRINQGLIVDLVLNNGLSYCFETDDSELVETLFKLHGSK